MKSKLFLATLIGLIAAVFVGATLNLPLVSSTATGDTSATPNTLAYRDSQGNILGAQVQGTQLYTAGTLKGTVVAKTSSFTAAAATDYTIDCTGGAVTVTLPTASANAGVIYHLMKIDSSGNAVTVSASGTTSLASQYSATRVFSDGTTWYSK